MLKKHGIKYVIEYYNLVFFLVFALLLFIFKDFIVLLLCLIGGVKSEKDIFFRFYQLITPITLTALWGTMFFVHIRSKAYRYRTGRSYSYDARHYHRSYFDLVSFFKDADSKIDTEELPTMKWQESCGLIFGKYKNKLLSYEPIKDGICAMIWGAPGDGKTTSTIITSCRQFGLRTNQTGKKVQYGSVMVTDLKGDIYEANKNYRKIKRFSTIDWHTSAHYDPLVDIRPLDPEDRAILIQNLSITLIEEENSAESSYFVDGARDFLTGICLYLLDMDSSISFPDIIEKIVLGNFRDWVIEIMQSEDIVAQSYTNKFFGENEKNVAGTYSKLVTSTRLFSSKMMKSLLSNDENMISPEDLEHGTDIYIQIDPNQITLMAPLISMIYQAFMSSKLHRTQIKRPIAFIMDEFGQIPAMPVIKQSAALMRAYNCSLMFACQSLGMIEERYGKSGLKSLMDCVKVHCFLSINDPDTREWASRLIGTRKVLKRSNNEQITGKDSAGVSINEARENIYEPDYFGRLPDERAVIIYKGGKYLKAEKTYYFE